MVANMVAYFEGRISEVFGNNVHDPTQGKLIDLIYIWPHQLHTNTGRCVTVLKYAAVMCMLSYYPISDFNLISCDSYLHTELYKF